MDHTTSRRNFLAGSAGFAAAGFASLGNPIGAAAQSVGVKAGDLPDLTIKEVKVYVTDTTKIKKHLLKELVIAHWDQFVATAAQSEIVVTEPT